VRILYVTQVDLDRPHGGARHVIAVTRQLAQQGHEVLLLAPGHPKDLGAVEHWRPPSFLRAGARLEAALALLALRARFQFQPDIAYVRLSASSSFVPWALVSARVPFVLELNGPVTEEMEAAGKRTIEVQAAAAVLAGVTEMSAHLVAVTESIGRYAHQVLRASRVTVIENGAELEVAEPGDRQEARRRLGLPQEARFIALVGTLAHEVRLDLLQAAHRKLPGVGLVIVGDGPKADYARAMTQAARPSAPVWFLGRQPHEQAILVEQAADVCISVRDGHVGMKGLEYAAVGRRQVAFDNEGIERLTALYPQEEAVFVVKERTPEALTHALSAALDAEARRGPLSPDAVETARAEIGWDRTAFKIAALLARILEQR
jgi:glycosyltransferase involved in cell wall biosynthesis